MKTSSAPVISIIVPVYKTEEYIVRCLESLINQTFRNIEIICVYDSFTDKSHSILQDYKQKDNRIILFHQTNQGLAAARNAGILQARGTYIQFCDSDDYFALEMCEKMYTAISTTTVDIAVCAVHLDSEGVPFWGNRDYLEVPFRGVSVITDTTFKEINVFSWNKIFRKDLIEEFHIVFPYGLQYEDAGFLFKYLTIAKAVCCIDDRLYNYGCRHDSAMVKIVGGKSEHAMDHLYIIRDVAIFLDTHGFNRKYEQAFTWMVLTYTDLACVHGGEKVYKTAFEAGAALLKKVDFNFLMAGNHDKNDMLRLYALKRNDPDMYFSLGWHKKELAMQSKRSLFFPALWSCVLFPWYIYKTFCMVHSKPLPRRSLGLIIKTYLFFPYYVFKTYLVLSMRTA